MKKDINIKCHNCKELLIQVEKTEDLKHQLETQKTKAKLVRKKLRLILSAWKQCKNIQGVPEHLCNVLNRCM